MTDEPKSEGAGGPKLIPVPVIAVLVVAAVFGGVLFAKSQSKAPGAQMTSVVAASEVATGQLTTTHNDALADYEAARKSGKPVYLLFHSLTCASCVEISAVVDGLLPEYADRVVFVNAISDDASARQLAARFQFQYIPTSFFIAPGGDVVDSFTGALSEEELRTRIESLIAQ
ncbi:MAG: thioredoxin family protein [Coriobacteriia bacterium]|nr:thioredoxin family protein [Coriobacteriia bacterium]